MQQYHCVQCNASCDEFLLHCKEIFISEVRKIDINWYADLAEYDCASHIKKYSLDLL